MKLKPTYNEGFERPDPGTCLFMIKEVKFELDDSGQQTCTVQNEIIDCIEVFTNVGKTLREYHGLHPVESKGKTLYFGITNFMGFLHKATGKMNEVDEKHFEDPKVQQVLEKKLVGMEYAGDVIHEKYNDKVTQEEKTAAKVKRYKSVAEFNEKKKVYAAAGGNGVQVASDAPPIAAAPAPTPAAAPSPDVDVW
jgi:hypothetical protein